MRSCSKDIDGLEQFKTNIVARNNLPSLTGWRETNSYIYNKHCFWNMLAWSAKVSTLSCMWLCKTWNLSNFWFIGLLHPPEQEKILQKYHVELLRQLNVELLLPYLNQHGLLTRDEHEDLINPLHTSAIRVSKLLVWLPRKGSRFLYRFVQCLDQSTEECPPHKELGDLLQRTIRSTVHRQGSKGQYIHCEQ